MRNPFYSYEAAPGPPLPVIFISARAVIFDVRLASVRAGEQPFFTKPVRNDQLVKTLRALVGIETSEPYRVLLVDDDVHLLDLYREVLQKRVFRFSVPPMPLPAWHCCRRMIRS